MCVLGLRIGTTTLYNTANKFCVVFWSCFLFEFVVQGEGDYDSVCIAGL